MKPMYRSVEEIIRDRKEHEAEELRQLRNLKRNLESGIVFDVPPELMEILLTYKTEEL